MNAANRKAKLTKYTVKLRREVEYVAEMEIDARSAEEAEGIASASVDNDPGIWREGDVTSQSVKAKVAR